MSRSTIAILVALIGLVGVALFAVAAYAVTGWASASRNPVGSAPVRWTGLPVPVKSNAQWTSYTYAGHINAVARTGDLVWAGTDGGLVVWDLADGQADDGFASVPATRFTVEHGLPANRVTSLVAGVDGAIWAGTDVGLGRYDGRNWQIFTDANGLPDASVRDLTVDRDGSLWVATPAGLARYDGSNWSIQTSSDLLNPLPAEQITSLAVDRENQLWMGTGKGLAVFDGRRWSLLTTTDGLSENEIEDVLIGRSGEVWAVTANGVHRFEGTTWETFSLPPVTEELGDTVSERVPVAAVIDGSLHIASVGLDGRIQRLDPDTNQWQTVELDSDGEALPSITMLLAGERSDTYWVGTTEALLYYDGDAWRQLTSPSDLASPSIDDLLLSGDELWLATGSGVSHFDGQWQHYDQRAGLTGAVRVLDQTPDGTIWAATSDPLEGLSELEPEEQQWSTRICEIEAPASASIAAAATGPDGALWFATDNGLSHYDGSAWHRHTVQDGLPHNVVTALTVDDEGTVWAGTSAGLARFANGVWHRVADNPISHLAAAPDGRLWAMTPWRLLHVDGNKVRVAPLLPGSTAIRDMTANEDGVWLATPEGVVRFDGEVMEFHGEAAGLPSADVTAVMTAENGAVWAATSGNEQQIELSYFDGTRWQPHPLRDPAGEQLRNSVVFDVLAVPGAVWLVTAAGVERYQDRAWTAFGPEDGLPGRSVNRLVRAAGTVWAATEAGLARFDGAGWEAFGTAGHDQAGQAIQALASAPSGDLWLSLGEGWPNGLRRFDGTSWETVETLSETSSVRKMAFQPASDAWPDGRLVAVVDDAGSTYLGIYDGQLWTWLRASSLPLTVEQLHIAPTGDLWVTGTMPSETGRPSTPGLAILGVSDAAEVTVRGIYPLVTNVVEGFDALAPTTGAAPVLFGTDGRTYVGVGGRVLVFESTQDGVSWEPAGVLEPGLPFSRHTLALGQDEDGRIWVGTERGVAVSPSVNEPNITAGAWQTFYAPPLAPAWWGSVIAMEPRPDGGILLGTSSGGIGVYTGRAFDGVLRPSQGPSAWDRQFYPVTSVLADDDGQLWATSVGGGAARFDGSRWITHSPAETLVNPANALVVRDDVAWLGTESGLAIVSGLDEEVCRFARVEDGIATEMAMRDNNGNVWIGTTDHGLLQIDEGSYDPVAQWEGAPVPLMAEAVNGDKWFLNRHHTWLTWYSKGQWQRLPLDLQSVTATDISALDVAPNLSIWVGSSQGALVYNGRDWTAVTTADGLADNQVDALEVAADGSVWLATPGGLSHYNPTSPTR